MKSLSLNGPEAECIPSACLVVMLRKMAEKSEKPVTITVGEVPKPESRGMRIIGKWLLVVAALYFTLHVIVWWAKS